MHFPVAQGLAAQARPMVTLNRDGAGASSTSEERETSMLHWAAVFFIIALIAAFFGFFGIAGSAMGIAKVLFVIFLVLAVVSLLVGRRSAL
jgi:uncharacterized membrane protein YtjA (UPF0391 family)